MSAEMDTDESEEASLQKEPDNNNAEQRDDTYNESVLDNTILLKFKIGSYLLEKVETIVNIEQFILVLVNRRININIGLT